MNGTTHTYFMIWIRYDEQHCFFPFFFFFFFFEGVFVSERNISLDNGKPGKNVMNDKIEIENQEKKVTDFPIFFLFIMFISTV